jgi:hypothetical protein
LVSFEAQANPPPTATKLGCGTGAVAVTVLLSVSTRTKPTAPEVTQTAPAPAARLKGFGIGIRRNTRPVLGSTRSSSFCALLGIQSEPAARTIPKRPNAADPDPVASGYRSTGMPEATSTRASS